MLVAAGIVAMLWLQPSVDIENVALEQSNEVQNEQQVYISNQYGFSLFARSP